MNPPNSRFVILTHDHPFLHQDLMFEQSGTLRTWRLQGSPDDAAGCVAEELPRHRLLYLNYEGPVSGDRGSVVRWDAGVYRTLAESADSSRCVVQGHRLQGEVLLCRTAGDIWQYRFLAERLDVSPDTQAQSAKGQ